MVCLRRHFGDGHECAVEDELPHVAQNDAADEVRNEEARTEEVLALDAAGHEVGQQKGDDVGEDDGDDGVDEGASKRLPICGVGKSRLVVFETDERLRCRNAVPAGKCQIEAIEERQDHHGEEKNRRRTTEHQKLADFIGKLILFHDGSHTCRGCKVRRRKEAADPASWCIIWKFRRVRR